STTGVLMAAEAAACAGSVIGLPALVPLEIGTAAVGLGVTAWDYFTGSHEHTNRAALDQARMFDVIT
ncbi:MAG: hypothetical protein ACRD3W_13905, partial [Terriglobales bacterium]